jgi:hypothetical protein
VNEVIYARGENAKRIKINGGDSFQDLIQSIMVVKRPSSAFTSHLCNGRDNESARPATWINSPPVLAR